MPTPLSNFFSRLLTPIIDRTVREHLAVTETDNTFSRSIATKSPKRSEVGLSALIEEIK